MSDFVIVPLLWIRASRYCEISGDPMDTVESRINGGVWAAGVHYKRTGPRTLWINIKAVTEWLNNQKHVEAAPLPKALKSARGNAKRATG